MIAILLLGIVQGLTEFLPVSSSGHLVLTGALLGLNDRGLAVDVALHMGTLAAVVVVFRAELVGLVTAMTGRRRDPTMRRLGWLLALATVPLMLTGALLRSHVEVLTGSPRTVSLLLLITSGSMLAGEAARRRRIRRDHGMAVPAGHVAESTRRASPARTPTPGLPATDDAGDPTGRPLEQLDSRSALLVGLAQCVALLPGVSRSGMTIAAGMAGGMTRLAATRFSFLLSLPALIGAAVVTLPDFAQHGDITIATVVVGVTAAFVAGYTAIRVLLALVARAGLHAFAVYCALLAVVGVIAIP